MRPAIDYSVYLVTDRPLCRGRDLEWVVAEAVAGGATVVQLREKSMDTRDFYELSLRLRTLLDRSGVPLIINDRVDVALACGAAGVHVGQSDLPWKEARRLMGPDAIVGLSVDTVEQAAEAESADVDYLGIGPVFATTTKPDAGEPLGVDGFARYRQVSSRELVAIGAVSHENAEAVARAGADGVAVVSALCAAESPRRAAALLAQAVRAGRGRA
ncbi:MAG: thiamine phosphate synthase [Desulfatibacillaceae bacterium]